MAQTHYRAFTIDHTKVPSTQTNFPVVISGTYSWAASIANGGRAVNGNSGFDLRAYSDSGLSSALTYQLRSYNATTGAFNMVVLISSLSASVDTVIYIGLGDAALNTDASSTSVWDSNYKAVWALGDGTTLSLADSTSNGKTLTNTNSVTATAGLVGGMGAGSFNGSNQSLDINSAVLTTEPITLEALFNPNDNTTSGEVVSVGATASIQGTRSIVKRANGSPAWNNIRALHSGSSSVNLDMSSSTGAYTVSAWNYAATTFTGNTSRDVHPNGATKTSGATSSGTLQNAGCAAIGCRFQNATRNNNLAAKIGEVRISNVVRGDDWIKTTKANLLDIASFYSVGGEVSVGGTAYTLTASTGTFTETGNAANLLFGRKLAADAGTFTETGNAANLLFGRKLSAAVGTFTETGNDANLLCGRRLTAATGSFSEVGNAANLLFGRRLSSGSGTFTLTGNPATLTYTQAGAYTMVAGAGTFALTGFPASLTYSNAISLLISDTRLIVDNGRAYLTAYDGSTPLVPDNGRAYLTAYDGSTPLVAANGRASLASDNGASSLTPD